MAFVMTLAVVSLMLCPASTALAEQEVAENLPPEYRPFIENVNKAKAREMWADGITFRLPTAQEIKETQDLWPTIPLEKNAAFLYANAFAQMSLQDAYQEIPGSHLSSTSYDGNITPLREFITRHAKAIVLVKEAAAMDSCWFPPVFPQGGNLYEEETFFCVTATSILYSIVYDAAFVAEIEEEHEESIMLYLGLFGMAEHLYQALAPDMAIECGTFSSQGLERLIDHTPLSAANLRQIIATCTTSEISLNDLAMYMQRMPPAMAHDWKGVDWPKMAGGYSEYMGIKSAETANAQVSIEIKAGENALKVLKDSLRTQLAPEYNLERKLKEGLPTGSYSCQANSMPALLRKHGEYNARLRALQLRAAMHLYQKKHGKLPETQAQLSPEFLAELPVDPFSGRPFHYKKTDEGWTLWSVGTNLRDDGADETSPIDDLGPMKNLIVGPSLRDKKDIVFKNHLPSNAEVRSRRSKK